MTQSSQRTRVLWSQRASPLRPLGLIAVGPSARALAGRLLRRGDEELLRLRGVGGPQALVVLGAEPDLPWVNGVTYLGRDERAPALLVPTQLEPDVALPLYQLALLRECAAPPGPVAFLPAAGLLVPIGGAQPIERERLAGWLRDHA